MKIPRACDYLFVVGAGLALAVGCGDSGGDSGDGSTNTGASTSTSTTGTTTTGTTTTGTSSATVTTSTSTSTSTSSSSTTGGATGPLPADSSAAAISAFLMAEEYKDPSWLSISDAPTPPGAGSPHGNVRVYMSPALVQFRETNADQDLPPEAPGVMAVKEMYDDAQALIGRAVLFYPEDSVVYYCYGPAAHCSTDSPEATIDAPLWGDSDASAVQGCRFCHNGNVYTALP